MVWITLLMVCAYLTIKQASIQVWTIALGLWLALSLSLSHHGWLFKIIASAGLLILLVSAIKPLRQGFITKSIFHRARKLMPTMSDTERTALEAGTVGWDGELFSGCPDFEHLLSNKPIELSEEEHAFLEGPVNVLCRMIDDWDITHHHTDLPESVWNYIKEHRFLGMIIPKEYGGLDFSATAQMSVLVKLYGRSVGVATTVGVPNSLGPAELLLKYGTEAQKNHYLPRLARGIEIPCFALTGPNAGSDAASIPDIGIVCYEKNEGQSVVGIRLNWDKRYITLCPVATVIGLAFRLFDPDNILGKGHDVGISCALIPADTEGVVTGRRHFPLNTGFLNGPTQGKNVFVPLDCLIGGAEMAGHGWRMLMECLSVGRAISLPSSAVGGAQAAAMASGAYARVRKQFNMPIGRFEGIEEPLARIAANTYMMDAALTMTVASIDHGEKPSVAGALLKYHTTERARQICNDAMDIHGGKGICLGPNNYLARGYQAAPISITVEGANILTRSLIIFGQGAIRCHPYVYQEMKSIAEDDLPAFDRAFWGHVGFFMSNTLRSCISTLTDGRFTRAPEGDMRRYYQLIHRYSSHLAFLADFSMLTLGSSLKRREKLSSRLGDLLSHLYLASAVLRRFNQDGEQAADKPLVDWCCQTLFYDCEQSIQETISNFPIQWARRVLKLVLLPFGLRREKASDKLGQTVAGLMIEPNDTRSRLSRLVFSEAVDTCPLGQLEAAFQALCQVSAIEKRVADAVKARQLTTFTLLLQIAEAEQLGLLSHEEALALSHAEQARQRVIAVDDFDDSELRRTDNKRQSKKAPGVHLSSVL
jgi:acyl-CoA dehydrogenase